MWIRASRSSRGRLLSQLDSALTAERGFAHEHQRTRGYETKRGGKEEDFPHAGAVGVLNDLRDAMNRVADISKLAQ